MSVISAFCLLAIDSFDLLLPVLITELLSVMDFYLWFICRVYILCLSFCVCVFAHFCLLWTGSMDQLWIGQWLQILKVWKKIENFIWQSYRMLGFVLFVPWCTQMRSLHILCKQMDIEHIVMMQCIMSVSSLKFILLSVYSLYLWTEFQSKQYQ